MENTMKNSNNKLLIKILIYVGLSTALLMTGFEILKQLLHANITIWESHLITIVFTTFASIIVTYLSLQKHYSLLRILSGFIPICSWCKKIRDENGNWITFDVYLGKYSEAEFTHGICTECQKSVFKKREDA